MKERLKIATRVDIYDTTFNKFCYQEFCNVIQRMIGKLTRRG